MGVDVSEEEQAAGQEESAVLRMGRSAGTGISAQSLSSLIRWGVSTPRTVRQDAHSQEQGCNESRPFQRARTQDYQRPHGSVRARASAVDANQQAAVDALRPAKLDRTQRSLLHPQRKTEGSDSRTPVTPGMSLVHSVGASEPRPVHRGMSIWTGHWSAAAPFSIS